MDGERVGVSEAGVVAAGEVSRAAAVTVARSVPNGRAAGTIGAGLGPWLRSRFLEILLEI